MCHSHQFIMSFILTAILSFSLLLVLPTNSWAQDESTGPETIEELKIAIEKVLTETNTPAAGVALLNKDGSVWIAGLGKANVEQDIDASENTMFRIGSTSKMFVSLAILKLQEEGRVGLKDRVRDLAPEIEYENPCSGKLKNDIIHLRFCSEEILSSASMDIIV